MKTRKKELIIGIPMIILTIIIIFAYVIVPYWYVGSETVRIEEGQPTCQEGWIKYQLKSGILCSKTELTESQIEEFEG